ncbi:hypothetical protein GQX74_009397 [Glossina fuscipes]|nr:hypothetical protein GQX74_009397 [Glossina fuscipes]
MDENIESIPQRSYTSVYQKRMQRKHKLQNNISEESCLDGPNDINKTLSAELSTNGSEFHITDTELIECCNEVKVMMKEENNNIDAPERARGDNKKKTIVDIIFEDFSTTSFNSPTASPERIASDRCYDDIEKDDTYNTFLTSRKEEEDYTRWSGKLSAAEKKSNIKVVDDEGSEEMGSDYANIVLSQWVPPQDYSKQCLCQHTDDTLLALNDESKQTVLKSQNTLNIGHSTLNVPRMFRKNRLLSLNPKKNFRPPNELWETLNRNLLQIETTTSEMLLKQVQRVYDAITQNATYNRKYNQKHPSSLSL